MFKQKKPNRWSCLPTAFAMVTGIEVADLIETIGHDGSEIVVPENKEPTGRRGFHVQEIIDTLRSKYTIMEIQAFPTLTYDGGKEIEVYDKETAEDRFLSYLNKYKGVLIVESKSGARHALAVERGTFYDPDTGKERESVDGLLLESFFKVERL